MSVGFVGAGRMAYAMIRGFVNQKMVAPQQIIASDVEESARIKLQKLGAVCVLDNKHVAKQSDILFLSVKPQIISSVLKEIKPVMSDRTLVISVAAGVTIATIQEALGAGVRVIRVMPNTPMLIGMGASGFARGHNVTDCDIKIAKGFLDSVGISVETSEASLDAVTGLSGSGPAYAITLMEAMADGGVKMGLPRKVAQTLAAQTVAGAAQMYLETEKHPAAMRDEIVSPAGTTSYAMHALEKHGFRNAVISAVEAGALRSIELSALAQKAGADMAATAVKDESLKNNEKLSEDLAHKFEKSLNHKNVSKGSN